MGTRETWDKRADSFGKLLGNPKFEQGYVSEFMAKLAPESGWSVFDMACGSGALSIPLAEAGHVVCARDISPRMLEKLQEKAQAAGV